MQKILAGIGVILLCLTIVAGISFYLINFTLIPANGSPIIISIEKSTTATQLVNLLKQKDLIKSKKLMLALINYKNLAKQIKAGVYQIKPGETVFQFLEQIARGECMTFNFTIIAGTTQKRIDQDLRNAPYLNYVPESWRKFQGDYLNPEGLFLADTYKYYGGSDASSILNQAHNNLMHYLDSSWANRDPNLPYKSPYELLIAASIIEKESAVPQERKLIGGVLINRLRMKMPLQMDPTVIYSLGDKYKGFLTHEDLSVDSPYNTYRHRGLPVAPIAMVSKEALDAAAHPQLSNFLYFVARGDGTHQFSQTYKEQKQAINQIKHKG